MHAVQCKELQKTKSQLLRAYYIAIRLLFDYRFDCLITNVAKLRMLPGVDR